jgi:hypothetical protein
MSLLQPTTYLRHLQQRNNNRHCRERNGCRGDVRAWKRVRPVFFFPCGGFIPAFIRSAEWINERGDVSYGWEEATSGLDTTRRWCRRCNKSKQNVWPCKRKLNVFVMCSTNLSLLSPPPFHADTNRVSPSTSHFYCPSSSLALCHVVPKVWYDMIGLWVFLLLYCCFPLSFLPLSLLSFQSTFESRISTFELHHNLCASSDVF